MSGRTTSATLVDSSVMSSLGSSGSNSTAPLRSTTLLSAGKAVGVGLRLRREVHQADVGHAQQLLDLVGVGGDHEDGGVGRPVDQRGGVGIEVLVDEGGDFPSMPLALSSCLAMPREPLSRVPMQDALALEVAQGRDRQVAAGEHPDRLVEQPAHRAQLRVLGVPALLLLVGQAALQAADEVALHEAGGDAGVVVGQRPQRNAALQRPQHAAAFLVLDRAWCAAPRPGRRTGAAPPCTCSASS